jgi:hypothetical protein
MLPSPLLFPYLSPKDAAMTWIAQLLIPRRRKNHHELAGRAAHVLSDIGVDRFLNGTLLIDRQFRVRFVSCSSVIGPVHAAVRADALAQARVLRGDEGRLALAAQALQQQIVRLVEELMPALLAQSPALRALPPRRYRIAERIASASK